MSDHSQPRFVTDRKRPRFPARAVITGGMPYGNKDLHFGHIGGVFVQADVFARFLRDRIGRENVIFVSGTDCYGSPIVEEHRKRSEAGTAPESLVRFVETNHRRQEQTLADYGVEPNLFAASALSPYREIHEEIGAWLLRTLHANGYLEARTTPQFYDAERGIFLNGRQVLGRCPVEGCQAEKAYADECGGGHQYEPTELIDPKSALTGRRPEMRDVTNWYLRLPAFREILYRWLTDLLREESGWRPFAVRTMLEHFEPPTIHVTLDQMEALDGVTEKLPPHRRQEGRAKSVQLVFDRLEEMEAARSVLGAANIRYRTGKTLVPFRLTGNLDWGLAAPDLDGLSGLTFWVWPESLWAPISFTAAYLRSIGRSKDEWPEWWCSKDAVVYQFIGEDNVFFYGLPQAAMWLGTQDGEPSLDVPEGCLHLSHLIANRHLQFLGKKASSSGKVKPPMAAELLDHYTADQLRAHFISLGLGQRSVSFRPLPLDPGATGQTHDPVLKEGNLLSNAFNRAVRSCFYTAQKHFDGKLPAGEPSRDVVELSERAILDVEDVMFRHEFQQVLVLLGDYIREINQRWSRVSPYRDECDPEERRQALVDAFHMVRVATVLLHPVAPAGTGVVRAHLEVGEDFFGWDRIFAPLSAFLPDPANHALRFVPPRFDFFEKHPSQVEGV